jgi:hypothetical protein
MQHTACRGSLYCLTMTAPCKYQRVERLSHSGCGGITGWRASPRRCTMPTTRVFLQASGDSISGVDVGGRCGGVPAVTLCTLIGEDLRGEGCLERARLEAFRRGRRWPSLACQRVLRCLWPDRRDTGWSNSRGEKVGEGGVFRENVRCAVNANSKAMRRNT